MERKIKANYRRHDVVLHYDERRFGGKSGRYVHEREMKLLTAPLVNLRNKKILDFPCGTARVAAYLNHTMPTVLSQNRLYCWDSSSLMIKASEKKVKSKCIKFEKKDAFHLKNQNPKFNVILSHRFFIHLSKKEINIVLRNFRRILRPNGALVLDTYKWSPRTLLTKLNFGHSSTYAYSDKKFIKILNLAGYDVINKKSAFIFSTIIYRKSPSWILHFYEKLETIMPEACLNKTYWIVKPNENK